MKKVTVTYELGDPKDFPLVETYRGFNIVKDGECFMVHDPVAQTLFVVALDDTKNSGKRKFDEDHNTLLGSKVYIDHIARFRK